MGGGGWDVSVHYATNAAKAAAGRSTFDYYDDVKAGRVAAKVHELLDPTKPAGSNSPFAGKVMREVCVTDEHPDPTAILIWLDVTGSNYTAAKIVHKKLPKLQSYLQQGNFCADPQINVSAIGDANSDDFPLQFGQYESDNRMDAQIAALILEGNGGGQRSETYELGAYMAARHVNLEPYELFGKKGFVFFIGDEMPYLTIKNDYARGRWGSVAAHTLQSLTGDTIDEPIATKAIFDELRQKNNVFFLFQKQGAYSKKEIVPIWEEMLGEENVVILDDPNSVVEVIAAIIARFEGELNAQETAKAMLAAGGDARVVASAVNAIEKFNPVTFGGGRLAKVDGNIDLGSAGADRL